MTVRPLTERELENALISLMWERDDRGLLTSGPSWGYEPTRGVCGLWQPILPTHEGVFL